MSVALLLLALAAAPAPIAETEVRAYVARQEQLWNAGDVAGYYAAFTPDARFTDQAFQGDKAPAPYGTSTLADARAQTRRALATSKAAEAGQVLRVSIRPDGQGATVRLRVISTLEKDGKVRRLCAVRVQTLVRQGLPAGRGALRSTGQTDTYYRCALRFPPG